MASLRFHVPDADVGGTEIDDKRYLRHLTRCILVQNLNPGSDPERLRAVGKEMSARLLGTLQLHRWIMDECPHPPDVRAVERDLTRALAETPRWTSTAEVAPPETPTNRVDRVTRQVETLDLFAESMVCVALRALGHPRARGFYDYERKRVKKQAAVDE